MINIFSFEKIFNKIKSGSLLSFLPLLIIILIVSIILSDNSVGSGDDGRYLSFANNLLNGFYSLPKPNINLWNGPGYPLYLVPFLALSIPIVFIKI